MTAAHASSTSDDIDLTVAWFETVEASSSGEVDRLSWGDFASLFDSRREGEKDGLCFTAARFPLEPDRRSIRRQKANVSARTLVALDIETHKKSGEVPPPLREAVNRVRAVGWTCVGYTSHNHRPGDTRYRLLLPLTEEVAPDLPVPEIVAEDLNLSGVLDTSKVGAESLFYMPSCPYGTLDLHETILLPGGALNAAAVTGRAQALTDARQAEADRIAAEAHAEAEARRQAKITAGFDPDDSLIEKLRSRLDLEALLLAHGYDRTSGKGGTKYRHPNSTSGSYGADIKTFGGIERAFSHNANDPLHASNLPAWCAGVTAVDAVDVVAILDFGGDRTKALRELALRFGLNKAAERKALARLLFRLRKRQTPQADIETAARAAGERLGLTWQDVCRTAAWVAQHAMQEAA